VVVGGPAHQAQEVVDGPLVERARGHDLLGQDVERVSGDPGLLHEALAHPCHDDRRLEEVAGVLGEHLATARLAHPMAGAADPLQPGRDRAGRLDLHDEVDRAHVDPELQRAGRDQAAQAARLLSSSMESLCSGRTDPWCARTSEHHACMALRRSARRSARRRDSRTRSSNGARGSVEQARVHVRPDAERASPSPGAARSSTGTITSTSRSLRVPASTIRTGRGAPPSPCPPRNRAISSSGLWVADSPIR